MKKIASEGKLLFRRILSPARSLGRMRKMLFCERKTIFQPFQNFKSWREREREREREKERPFLPNVERFEFVPASFDERKVKEIHIL